MSELRRGYELELSKLRAQLAEAKPPPKEAGKAPANPVVEVKEPPKPPKSRPRRSGR